MALWYSLVDLLPFDWAQPGSMFFMKKLGKCFFVLAVLRSMIVVMTMFMSTFEFVIMFHNSL